MSDTIQNTRADTEKRYWLTVRKLIVNGQKHLNASIIILE